MFCSHCGAKVEDSQLFCQKCGYRMVKSAEEPKKNPSGWQYQTKSSADSRAKEHQNLLCGLAYFPILFWLPLVALPDSVRGKQSANQGLLLLICSAIQSGLGSMIQTLMVEIGFFPVSLLCIFFKIGVSLLGLIIFVFTLIGLVKGCQGEFYEIPLIGKMILIK